MMKGHPRPNSCSYSSNQKASLHCTATTINKSVANECRNKAAAMIQSSLSLVSAAAAFGLQQARHAARGCHD
eukprot:CAMPEP_0202882222 /NCGR_PEP_ID=MMETSP1391-20130828/37693_1 /ASSEMBLY_ACC=CAM_ASM_000867 /TAXON_ID=1034604 /ORGANISM="Chlamydomonas leiostraca, Strain SAG 11-49" /LENGTH=71 /DNA_ID=CAMNT_0049565045 /DNA_START=180 /DNA_END=392 /DNA_ORIENTATION=-